MLTRTILRHALRAAADRPFAVRYWDDVEEQFGEGDPVFRLIIRDPCVLAPENDPSVAVGEAYMDGRVDVEGDLGQAVSMASRLGGHVPGPLAGWLVRHVVAGRRSHSRQKSDVAHHYDLGNDFFSRWLDKSMTYSCAYFYTPEDTLEQAQEQKIDHSLRKLRLKRGESLLDIGSGWGALVMRAAERYGVRALGITLSEEQYAASCRAIQDRGLEERADVRLTHYQTLAHSGARFDKVVTIGMIEHVGKEHLGEFFDSLQSLVKPGGLALCHQITSPVEGPINGWIRKYIFPGAYLPTVPELAGYLSERGFRILDVENLREHYRMTLDRWSERFERCADWVRDRYGDRFERMWRLYLRGTSAGFREGCLEIHQILVSNGISCEVPLTRADLYA